MTLTRTDYLDSHRAPRGGSTGHGESKADIEDYLMPLDALRGAALHGWGVVDGLRVTAEPGTPGLAVMPGVALDAFGRALVLTAGAVAVVDPAPPGGPEHGPVTAVTATGVTVVTAGPAGERVLALSWNEFQDGGQLGNSPVLRHAPWLALIKLADFDDDGTAVPLARVTVDDAGAVTGLTGEGRRSVDVRAGRLELRRLRAVGGAAPAVDQVPAAELRSRPDGGVELNLLDANGAARKALSVDGATGNILLAPGGARVGVGVADPQRALHVQGSELHVGGPGGGLSFGGREVTGLVEQPTAGERWVWYASGGTARLWSGADQLSVGAGGPGGGLDVSRSIRVRQGADGPAGMWLWQQAPAEDRAFVGMRDDDHVGLYSGRGAGWGLTLDVTTGDLATARALVVGAGGDAELRTRHLRGKASGSDRYDDLYLNWDVGTGVHVGGGAATAPLYASGDVVVGAGGNATLKTRHINGKVAGNDGDDDLYLNWANGHAVHVGGATPADLIVTRNLQTSGTQRAGSTLFADGGMELPPGAQLHGAGRLHIHGEEILFLLNKSGVHVSTAWGGNGQLTVDDCIATNGKEPRGGLPDGWYGGVHTWDLYAEGTIGCGPASPGGNVPAGISNTGTVWGRRKQFVIDHPLDPEHRRLTHVCIEGPEAGVYYRGEGRLAAGRARVELPGYFEALVRAAGRTVMLTAVCDVDEAVCGLGTGPVTAGGFDVRATDDRNPSQRFYWEVKAVRADVELVEVETEKLAGLAAIR